MQLQLNFSTSKQLFTNRSFLKPFSFNIKMAEIGSEKQLFDHFSILGFQTTCLEKVIMISHLKQSDNGILLFCRGISLKRSKTSEWIEWKVEKTFRTFL